MDVAGLVVAGAKLIAINLNQDSGEIIIKFCFPRIGTQQSELLVLFKHGGDRALRLARVLFTQ